MGVWKSGQEDNSEIKTMVSIFLCTPNTSRNARMLDFLDVPFLVKQEEEPHHLTCPNYDLLHATVKSRYKEEN